MEVYQRRQDKSRVSELHSRVVRNSCGECVQRMRNFKIKCVWCTYAHTHIHTCVFGFEHNSLITAHTHTQTNAAMSYVLCTHLSGYTRWGRVQVGVSCHHCRYGI